MDTDEKIEKIADGATNEQEKDALRKYGNLIQDSQIIDAIPKTNTTYDLFRLIDENHPVDVQFTAQPGKIIFDINSKGQIETPKIQELGGREFNANYLMLAYAYRQYSDDGGIILPYLETSSASGATQNQISTIKLNPIQCGRMLIACREARRLEGKELPSFIKSNSRDVRLDPESPGYMYYMESGRYYGIAGKTIQKYTGKKNFTNTPIQNDLETRAFHELTHEVWNTLLQELRQKIAIELKNIVDHNTSVAQKLRVFLRYLGESEYKYYGQKLYDNDPDNGIFIPPFGANNELGGYYFDLALAINELVAWGSWHFAGAHRRDIDEYRIIDLQGKLERSQRPEHMMKGAYDIIHGMPELEKTINKEIYSEVAKIFPEFILQLTDTLSQIPK